MSYESVKLAQAPVLYARLDQGGFGVNCENVPDISGNNLDLTLTFDGSGPAWGHVSPIETDPASREFWGYTNATIYGFTGHSIISRASDALMDPAGKDVTIGEWLRPMVDTPDANTYAMVQKGGTCGTLLLFNGGTRIGGYVLDSAGTLYTVFDPTFVITDRVGQSMYVVVVRSGDALALYIDGTLRNFTTVTSGLPTQFTSADFNIHPNHLGYSNARHDEVEYHTRALTGAEVLESYEAALNALNMRGECNIRTTATLNGTETPDPVAYSFRHNWTNPVIERFRWKTGVFKPTNGSTELVRQRSSLRRQVEYTHLLYTEKLRRQFEARSFGGRTSLTQFEPDKVRVANLLSSATSATFDTTYMDFEVGHRVLIYQDDDNYEFQTLTVVDDTHVEWEDGLSQDYTLPWVKPARVARLPLNQDVELQSDVYADTSTIYEYEPEDEPLSPRRVTPFTPTLTYRSRECFDLAEWQGHDYSELPTINYVADRNELDFETGVVGTKQYRWGSEMVQPYNMNLQGRPLIAKYLGWLYERAGQYSPFWMPTFRQDLKPLGSAGADLTVEGHEYSNLYAEADNRIDLAFVYFDNTVIMRRIDSVAVSGANDVLTLDASVPTFTNLRWLSFLRRVILASDDLEIAWETDNVVRVAFAVTDAPLDFALGSPSESPSPSLSTSLSPSPSHSASSSRSPSGSGSPSTSTSPSTSPSASISPSSSTSPSHSASPSV